MFFPSEKEFLRIARLNRRNYRSNFGGLNKTIPLIFEKPLEKESPLEIYENLRKKDSILLESLGEDSKLTEYSFIALDPLAKIKIKGKNVILDCGEKKSKFYGNPFHLLREILNSFKPRNFEYDLPFWGGALGYLSYDMVREIERLPHLARDDLNIWDSIFFIPQILLIFSHRKKKFHIIVNSIIDNNPQNSYKSAASKVMKIIERIENPSIVELNQEVEPPRELKSNMNQKEFESKVSRIKEYIRAGDVFQVNFSQRLECSFKGEPFELYKNLREINPSPFAAYLDFGSWQLVSSSPERLIMLKEGIAQARPIGGTYPRGADLVSDDVLSGEMLLNPKEKAEHIMLVDLERNDLGRVSEYGTVRPSELMTVERYSHVIHIVSNIVGKLHKEKDQFDLIKAMFPGGTITGCPKVRCMEIIEEMEPVRRGPYTGSIGYFGFNGNMDMNIIIRTFVVNDNRSYIQVGAGIVADSNPTKEYFETLSKGEALIRAIGGEYGEITDIFRRLTRSS